MIRQKHKTLFPYPLQLLSLPHQACQKPPALCPFSASFCTLGSSAALRRLAWVASHRRPTETHIISLLPQLQVLPTRPQFLAAICLGSPEGQALAKPPVCPFGGRTRISSTETREKQTHTGSCSLHGCLEGTVSPARKGGGINAHGRGVIRERQKMRRG